MREGSVSGEAKGIGSRAKFALAALALILIALFASAALPKDWVSPAVMALLFLLAYVPITPLALRARIDNRVLRYFFGLTAVPVFMVMFAWMLHRLSTGFPQLGSSQALALGGRLFGLEDDAASAAVIVIPTALVFGVWYALIRGLDYGIRRFAARFDR